MIFFEISSIDPYEEKEIYRFDYQDIQKHLITTKANINGVHTYNSTDDMEIIDVSYNAPVSKRAAIWFFLYRHTMVFKAFSKLRKYLIKRKLR